MVQKVFRSSESSTSPHFHHQLATMPPKNKRAGAKKFPRTEFHEQPESGSGSNIAGAPSSNKKWVYHKACFSQHLAELIDGDARAVAIGSLAIARERSTLIDLCTLIIYNLKKSI